VERTCVLEGVTTCMTLSIQAVITVSIFGQTLRYYSYPFTHFKIADFRFFRGERYTNYFNYLDRAGGFFYERWGDAPVHSLAVGLFLKRDQVHYFGDIGYRYAPVVLICRHATFTFCPTVKSGCTLNCNCNGTSEWSGLISDFHKVAGTAKENLHTAVLGPEEAKDVDLERSELEEHVLVTKNVDLDESSLEEPVVGPRDAREGEDVLVSKVEEGALDKVEQTENEIQGVEMGPAVKKEWDGEVIVAEIPEQGDGGNLLNMPKDIA
jgi:hypothetical protein